MIGITRCSRIDEGHLIKEVNRGSWRVTSRVAIIIRSIACVFSAACGFLRGDKKEEEEEKKEKEARTRMRSYYTSWRVDQLEGGHLPIYLGTRVEEGETRGVINVHSERVRDSDVNRFVEK